MRTVFRQLWDLSSRRERLRFGRLAGTVLLSNILETLAVGALLPFMIVVSDPASVLEGRMRLLHQAVGAPERSTFLLLLGGAVLGVVVLSNLVAALTTWSLQRFAWRKHHDLSRRVMLHYLRQPYLFFLGRNSAELSRNVLSEVETAVTGVVLPLLFGFARVGLAVLIVALLLVVDPLVALAATLVIGGGYAVIFVFVRRRMGVHGRRRLEANEARFRAAVETLSGVKAVKILGREEAFLERFSIPSELFARSTARREVLQGLPRYALETLAFGGMVVLVVLVLLRPDGTVGVLPTLATFGFAGLKLMPALQQIFASVATVGFYAPSLGQIHRELVGDAADREGQPDGPRLRGEGTSAEGTSAEGRSAEGAKREGAAREGAGRERVNGAPLVALQGVAFRYPGAARPSLGGVTLEIRPGHLYGLVGATGAGKTTAMDLLMGLLEPTEGGVLVDGAPLDPPAAGAWRRRVGYVPQEVFLTDDTIGANIAFGLPAGEVDRARVEEVGRIARLDEVVARLSQGYGTFVGERGTRLSGGQRQRIGIARALYPRPELLVLDEGTSALDASTEAAIVQGLRALGTAVLWVTHRLATIRGFDTILVFDEGRLVGEGSHDELMARCAAYARLVTDSGLARPDSGEEAGG